MITAVNYTQSNTHFKARVKMGTSGKIGTYLKSQGINPNVALFTSAAASGGLATLAMLQPGLVTHPEFMKYGLFAGMTGGLGMMVGNTIADNQAKNQREEEENKRIEEQQKANPERKNVLEDPKYGKMALTDKGLNQYLSLLATSDMANSSIISTQQSGHIAAPKVTAAFTYADKCLNTLAQLGELPDVIPNASNAPLQLEMPK